MWADFALSIAPSAAVTIASGDFDATPFPDEPPHAEIAHARSREQAADAAIRQRIRAQPSLNELADAPRVGGHNRSSQHPFDRLEHGLAVGVPALIITHLAQLGRR